MNLIIFYQRRSLNYWDDDGVSFVAARCGLAVAEAFCRVGDYELFFFFFKLIWPKRDDEKLGCKWGEKEPASWS